MSDERQNDDLIDAAEAEAEEALAAAEEAIGETAPEAPPVDVDPEIQEALDASSRRNLHAKAWWSTSHKEHRTFLFANCLLFASVFVAWTRVPGNDLTGLDTIRGAAIFGLTLYGFWATVFNIWFRQFYVAPFFLSGVIGLWVGIQGIMTTFSSGQWDAAIERSKLVQGSLLDRVLAPLSSIAPAYWLTTIGGALILVVFLRGILGGRAQAKATQRAARESGGSTRRRRR